MSSLDPSPHRPSSRLSALPSPPASPLPYQVSFFSQVDTNVSSTIAEVLSRSPESPLDLSTVSALANKAKGLQSDNRRLRSDMRDLAAERSEMAMEIERLRSAMRDIVRVAEIIAIPQCGCRSQPSTAPTSPACDTFPHSH
jgi:hypothetical protein